MYLYNSLLDNLSTEISVAGFYSSKPLFYFFSKKSPDNKYLSVARSDTGFLNRVIDSFAIVVTQVVTNGSDCPYVLRGAAPATSKTANKKSTPPQGHSPKLCASKNMNNQ